MCSRSIRCSNGLRQPNAPIQRLWTGALVVRGPAWSGAGPVSRVERHPEQPADALARGQRPGDGLPHAVEQQQRQHVRLPGPPALLRASDPARRALRARRLDHGDRRSLRRQAAQLAQRRRAAPGRLRTGSPIRRTAASSTRARPTRPAVRATRRAGSSRGWARRSASATTSASCRPTCTALDPSGKVELGRRRGSGPGSERARALAGLQEALRHQHRQGPRRHRARRQGRDVRPSTSAATTRCRTGSSSATSWSTA